MKRLCVLGNSHAACFKVAWDEMRGEREDITLTFFAERGAGLLELMPKDGVLAPRSEPVRKAIEHTSQGLSVVDPRVYDAVLLVGLYVIALPQEGFFSAAMLRQWLIDSTPRTIGYGVARKLRAISRIPIFFAHQPLLRSVGPSEAVGDVDRYRNSIAILNDDVFSPLGVKVLEQPLETIADGGFTNSRYSIGAQRLNTGDLEQGRQHSEHDRLHTNKEFGRLFLAAYFPEILGANK